MMRNMLRADRMRLMRFLCSFAWADFEIHAKERAFVAKLVKRLHLDPDETHEVDGWLKVPPAAEDLDPAAVPAEHRKLFLDLARQMVAADGTVDPEEDENLKLLEDLLR